MTSAYDFIESALASLRQAKKEFEHPDILQEDQGLESNLQHAIGHIDDAISELNDAKAMLY